MYTCNISSKLTLLFIVVARINENREKGHFSCHSLSFHPLFLLAVSLPRFSRLSFFPTFLKCSASPSPHLPPPFLLSSPPASSPCPPPLISLSLSSSCPSCSIPPPLPLVFPFLSRREMCSSLVCSPHRLTSVCPSHLAALLRSHLHCRVAPPPVPPPPHPISLFPSLQTPATTSLHMVSSSFCSSTRKKTSQPTPRPSCHPPTPL